MMRYVRTLVKHWYLYLVPIIIIPVLVTLNGFDKLTLYDSTALLWVDKPPLLSTDQIGWNTYLSPAQNEAAEMQQKLASPSFVVGVATKTDLAQRYNLGAEAGQSQASTRVTSEIAINPLGWNVLQIIVSDKEPHLAQQIVQALLESYQSYYQTRWQQMDKQAQTFYLGQQQTAKAAVDADTKQLQEYCRTHQEACSSLNPTDPALAQLHSQLDQDQQTLTAIQAKLTAIAADVQATDPTVSQLFQVTDAPHVPTRPTLDKKKLLVTYTGGGLAAALALVALIVFIRTQLDRKVYGEDDLRIIQEDLELTLGGGIVTLPVIAGMDAPAHANGDPDDALDGILVPVLTALPRLRAQDVRRELRKAAGTQPAALASATRAEDTAEESEA
jgi:uncharacterized protein involved in exopolysaccharide biosynthesis